MAPVDVAPGLFGLARRKKLTVKDALAGNRWMKDLERLASEDLLDQLVKLWELLQPIVLSNVPDTIRWKISNDGGYSAASAYNAQFVGRIARPQLHASWRIKAEPKVKFHMWLLIQNRTWTADRLATRGWPHKDKCTFCDQVLESAAADKCTKTKVHSLAPLPGRSGSPSSRATRGCCCWFNFDDNQRLVETDLEPAQQPYFSHADHVGCLRCLESLERKE